MDFALHLPINSVSFGQASIAILRELHKRGYSPNLFYIGAPNMPPDLSAQSNITPEFQNWLSRCLANPVVAHKRKTPIFKLWHIHDSLNSFSEKQVLLTFHELDSPTKEEVNIVKNQAVTLFTSTFTQKNFAEMGATNTQVIPLGFDTHNFFVKEKQYFQDGRITFNLVGKLERRKHHAKTIRAWLKKYGDNPKYFLNCAIFNPFLPPEEFQAAIHQIVGKRYDNIQFLGFMPKNEEYNDYLNSGDIVIGVSGGEGFGLPEFQSIGLGKHAVILNAHSYKEFATEENAVLLSPAGKVEAYDGKFFHKGQPFNQGNIYDFDDDEFIAACEQAVKRFENSPKNVAGLKIQQQFTYAKTVDGILCALESIK